MAPSSALSYLAKYKMASYNWDGKFRDITHASGKTALWKLSQRQNCHGKNTNQPNLKQKNPENTRPPYLPNSEEMDKGKWYF